MKKFDKFKEIKFDQIPSKYKESFTEQDAEEIYKEALRRVEWEKGEKWFEACSYEVVREEITSKLKGLAEAYFERQEIERKVNKIMGLIIKAVNNSYQKTNLKNKNKNHGKTSSFSGDCAEEKSLAEN